MSVRAALLDFGRTKRRARRPPQICTTLAATDLGVGVRGMFQLYRTPHIITASVSGQLGDRAGLGTMDFLVRRLPTGVCLWYLVFLYSC